MATTYNDIHTARFGNQALEIAPLEFIDSLSDLCLRAAKEHFEKRSTFAGVPEKYKDRLCSLIPTDLGHDVSAPLIDNEIYWKRIANDMWDNLLPADHGHSWKQLCFEKMVEEACEKYIPPSDKDKEKEKSADPKSNPLDPEKKDPNQKDPKEELDDLLNVAHDFVFKLKIRQFASQDIGFLFDKLPNLYSLSITYGSRNVGMSYERSKFGMKLLDAECLSQQLPRTETLTSLVLSENVLDDEKVRRLVVGLRDNLTITDLDLSHNKISDRGSRALCKCLGKDSVITRLSLCDNHIHSEGGKFLGRALQSNIALADLNMRLNRLGEKGGCYIFEGLKSNSGLVTLNISGNGLGDGSGQGEAVRVFAAMLRVNSALKSVDMSSNSLGAEGGVVLRDSLDENTTLLQLDTRINKIAPEVVLSIKELLLRNEETLKNKKAQPAKPVPKRQTEMEKI